MCVCVCVCVCVCFWKKRKGLEVTLVSCPPDGDYMLFYLSKECKIHIRCSTVETPPFALSYYYEYAANYLINFCKLASKHSALGVLDAWP